MGKDYYKILGINQNATKEEIKQAYKRLVKQYHPDINPNIKNQEKIKEINEAYSVLSDENKKANYERFGSAGEQFSSGFGGFEGFGDFDDIFDSFFEGFGFGGRKKRRWRKRGEDIYNEVEISFKESFFGANKKINVKRHEKCKDCEGTGAKHGRLEDCPACHGSGMQKRTLMTPFGIITQSTTCSKCKGNGQTASEICPTCNGGGKVKTTKTIDVNVPAGIHSGTTLKLRGEGEIGIDAPNGDLFVEVHVEPDEIFQREEDNILINVPISFAQAVLGDEIEAPTMEKKVKIKIPPFTQTHTIFRMKGKGFPNIDGDGRGDQYVQVIIHTPTKVSKREKELLEELKTLTKETPIGKASFFTKVKEAFKD